MPPHSEDAVSSRRAIVARHHLTKMHKVDIAAKVGVSQGQISPDPAAIA